MLKHFDIWPSTIDKNNLFEEQKVFILYLISTIPEKENWSIQLEYQRKVEKIKKMDIHDIEITKADLDIAKIQGTDISQLKQKRLIEEKNKKLEELNKAFGKEKEESEKPDINIEGKDVKEPINIWEKLQGKGLID